MNTTNTEEIVSDMLDRIMAPSPCADGEPQPTDANNDQRVELRILIHLIANLGERPTIPLMHLHWSNWRFGTMPRVARPDRKSRRQSHWGASYTHR